MLPDPIKKMKKNNNSRKQILDKISGISRSRIEFNEKQLVNNEDIYKPVLPDLVTCFKNELDSINGKCLLSDNEDEQFLLIENYLAQKDLKSIFCRDKKIAEKLIKNQVNFINDEKLFEGIEAGITSCEFLIARTGSVMVSSAGDSGRQMNVFPPVHIVIAEVSQLLELPEDALKAIKNKYGNKLPSSITTITGPSRTADIEKTLVLGAHGPKDFVVFLRLN